MNRRMVAASVLVVVTAGAALTYATPALAAAPAPVRSAFTPSADAPVDATNPFENFEMNQLVVSGVPWQRRSYLRFSVTGLTGYVASAHLRVHVWNVDFAASVDGGTVRQVAGTSWSESTVTYGNAPPLGAGLGNVGPVVANRWYDVDVTPAVTGNGPVALALSSTSDDAVYYDSREQGANAPQLVVATTAAANPVRLFAAGDIGACGSSGDQATAAVIGTTAGVVAPIGDLAAPAGSPAQFRTCYGPSWGRFKARTRPAPGNHDYLTLGAAGYFGYFGAAAGPRDSGYYSYDLGTWHIVVLNSNCSKLPGGCGAGSAEERWLRADLGAHRTACTAAYWHEPLFSSGAVHPGNPAMRPLFQALYDFGADVVLNAHSHNYERFARQTPTGAANPTRGIREFIVGTGGQSHQPFATPVPNSQVRNATAYGVLQLTLNSNSYSWRFVPVAGATFTDSGSDTCH